MREHCTDPHSPIRWREFKTLPQEERHYHVPNEMTFIGKLENLKNVTSVIRDFIPQEFSEYPVLQSQMDLQSLEGRLDIPM